MMHEFARTYANRIANPEDFKAILEKYMNAVMDLGRNHKMDWFFNEYVYGTSYPTYKFMHSFSTDAGGNLVLNFTLSQSDVGDNFVMAVPVYLDFGGGRTIRLGSARMKGTQSIEQHIHLKGLIEKPKRALVAYFHDLMANENKYRLPENKNRRLFSPEIFSAGLNILPLPRKDQAAHLHRPTGSRSKGSAKALFPRCRFFIAKVNHKSGGPYLLNRQPTRSRAPLPAVVYCARLRRRELYSFLSTPAKLWGQLRFGVMRRFIFLTRFLP